MCAFELRLRNVGENVVQRVRNQRGEGSRLRSELIEAAMRLLDKSPSTPLSLRMVAREAGVAAPSIYPHFQDAQTLMSEIVRECWRQMGAALAGATHPEGQPPLERLKAQMASYVEYAMERPSRYQLLFAMHSIDPESDMMDGYMRPAYRQVSDTVEAVVAAGRRLPADDLQSATLLVISVAHGRIALAHLAPDRPGNSMQSVMEFVSDQIERAFPLH